jgi:hypothetical protein
MNIRFTIRSVLVSLSPASSSSSTLIYRQFIASQRAFAFSLLAAITAVGCEGRLPLVPSPGETTAVGQAATEKRSDHTIRIRNGSFVFLHEGQGGPLNIAGTRGFRLDAFLHSGAFGADTACTPACPPGATVPLHAIWSGSGVLGEATLQGTTYTHLGGGHPGQSDAYLEFTGIVTPPPLEAGQVTVTTSFEFSGLFWAADPISSTSERFLLSGDGTVTLTLQPAIDDIGWRLIRAEFEFN